MPTPLTQRTLKSITRAMGLGLHSGQRVEITLHPAPENTGIVFRRVDLPTPVDIPVNALAVCDTRMASTVSPEGASDAPKVQTIEHILSACCGLGLDNLRVDITADEVPILDGSAASFVFLLQSAGIAVQDAPKRFLRLKKPVRVSEGSGPSLKWAQLEPFDGYTLDFEISFDHPAVSQTGQTAFFDLGGGDYIREIARARTFGFTKDVEALRARGLAIGASMDNAVVVGDRSVLNSEGLRYPNEFARHKILDAMGDLHIGGWPILGHYSAYKGGHGLNNQLLRQVLADPDSHEFIHFDDERQAPPGFSLGTRLQ
ncbi:UDP-3-O-acyl-N-acetylglucosamine deacetylase [Amphibiibacter pelophylacis]|uniref:UDP-3-O-acyl-N-acetylglucosamine deacetylase n=1 Tax=Amphibiibacter pelophylacis TaxID=1799477 RepID=A0ACC6P5F0_9BURK